ncbi:acyl-(acyl-carrier-protein)--UDP-N-acetylglucosamine O-acyltransferase [Gloeothece citriformis PCC 7424]|uniref:Acyl-[acyl-carrier-protein]--UDP-N-acetylglucosamine O-acyltransferase n=1 Tax=Gloeothece citriformis (strain PCC 7424) TaxID=65393 RepID=LPXA_GLOC7|nr:acyl-ACP--UDP-N-acetylglucosamine O-acyltransferase [Gloeothece citriformis]B7KFS2.1 RecName: Full=Acyl-[acyl-carrier-protein]--UDP-N-acetylglucosamine O-acyltransferase; Short=UDP-N-acetylglucosamine acyltransferase [Gloeothece citriformis PCC 7424]ACK73397.1 acyl-(acyl-carrier-protein)--UDP-N-acetylglucosamine O-acyltransferase [Gloeothece citriformis PCC 7424]
MLINIRPGDAPLSTPIHPTAIIHPNAELHPSVQVAPYAVIGEQVKIGASTIIGPNVVIEGPTEIGVGNRIFAGAVIGTEPQDLKYRGAASQVKIGDHNQIREYVTINRATGENEVTQIGNNNLLMAYAHVAHNCVIEDEVIIANSVALAGHIYIESKARISGVLGVHQFVHIGRLAMVGGMARIERDVPPFTTVEGNPSRVRTLNLIGLKRAGVNEAEISEMKKAFRLIYRSNLTLKQALEQLESWSNNPYVQHLRDFLHQSTTVTGRRGPIPGKE